MFDILCNECLKPVNHSPVIVSVHGLQFHAECYIKHLEKNCVTCPVCEKPIRGRQKTSVFGGKLIHAVCEKP
jgi:hypothetical protein